MLDKIGFMRGPFGSRYTVRYGERNGEKYVDELGRCRHCDDRTNRVEVERCVTFAQPVLHYDCDCRPTGE